MGALTTYWRTLPRHTVAVAALSAFLLRFPGLMAPIWADEAGFTMVAHAWAPAAESLYGPHFVDRPPLVIAVYGAAGLLGAPTTVRVLGALGAAITVLLLARVAREIALDTRVDPRPAERWTAVAVAALVASPLINGIAAKGELLALPFIAATVLCALRARYQYPIWDGRRRLLLAGATGLLGMTAVGFKQNLIDGLVFAGVLWTAAWLGRELSFGSYLRLGFAALAGALVPVLATIGWAWYAGVELGTLWYAVYGFRVEAAGVLSLERDGAAYARLELLLAIAVGAGLVALLVGFLVHLPRQWRTDRDATTAAGAMLLVGIVGVLGGGSFWRDYLFQLIPPVAVGVALLLVQSETIRFRVRVVAVFSVLSTLVTLALWVSLELRGWNPYDAASTGDAVAAAAEPGDTLTVHGGRADIQFRAGLESPYEHLWSLPMRTLDPDYAQLRTLVRSDRAPTWIVEWVGFTTWDDTHGGALAEDIAERYEHHGTGCEGAEVYLLRGVERPPIVAECGSQ